MPPLDSPGRSITLSVLESEVILKALSYYQIRLFDKISEHETQLLAKEMESTTALIKRIHRFQENQNHNPSGN